MGIAMPFLRLEILLQEGVSSFPQTRDTASDRKGAEVRREKRASEGYIDTVWWHVRRLLTRRPAGHLLAQSSSSKRGGQRWSAAASEYLR